MPTFTNLSCIEDLVDVVNPCTADQSAVEFFLDDLGISLSDVSKIADERYIQGQVLVDNKIRIALDDVYTHLTRNTIDCDLDLATGLLCDNASKIARAVWYKTASLIFKELTLDSSRYNEFVHYGGNDALLQMVYYDSTMYVFTTVSRENQKAGLYQRELDKLESIRRSVEQSCCVDGTGQTGWSITIP